MMRGNILLTL